MRHRVLNNLYEITDLETLTLDVENGQLRKMSFSCLGPSGSPSLRPYWPPSFGRLNSVTPRDNGSTTDLAQTPTTSCSSSGWCSLWDSTGSWAYMSGRSYTRTGIQDPR